MWKSLAKTSVSFSASLASGKYHKTVYCSVGVLESFSANPLRWLVRSYLLQNLTLKESHLLINFVKNELPGKYFSRVLKLFIAASTCHMALILSRYSHSHWQDVFSVFPFPEFKSLRTIKLVSSKFTSAVLFLTIHNYFSFVFLEHLNTFETTFSYILVAAWNLCWYQMAQTGYSTTVPFKIEIFVTIFDIFHILTIATKIFILDAVDVLHATLITNIFASQSWIFIILMPIFP